MKIAIYINDLDREPYLVHHIIEDKGLVSLGIFDYPDTPQDFYTSLDEVMFLKGVEYALAKKEIEEKLA